MENLERIIWNETLMTGVKVIDEQHQILVNMINDANSRISENCGREPLEEIVRDLMSYALYHFDTEEEMMLENSYDAQDQEAHFQEHRKFSAKVSALQQELQQGKLFPREKLTSFLYNWLINHILKTDMQLARFLAKPQH